EFRWKAINKESCDECQAAGGVFSTLSALRRNEERGFSTNWGHLSASHIDILTEPLRASESLGQERALTSWENIVREHGQMAFAAAWRVLGHAGDAEDAVQEALLDAFDLHRSQPVASWGALLRRLATCRALDLLRKRRPAEPLSPQAAGPAAAEPPAV